MFNFEMNSSLCFSFDITVWFVLLVVLLISLHVKSELCVSMIVSPILDTIVDFGSSIFLAVKLAIFKFTCASLSSTIPLATVIPKVVKSHRVPLDGHLTEIGFRAAIYSHIFHTFCYFRT